MRSLNTASTRFRSSALRAVVSAASRAISSGPEPTPDPDPPPPPPLAATASSTMFCSASRALSSATSRVSASCLRVMKSCALSPALRLSSSSRSFELSVCTSRFFRRSRTRLPPCTPPVGVAAPRAARPPVAACVAGRERDGIEPAFGRNPAPPPLNPVPGRVVVVVGPPRRDAVPGRGGAGTLAMLCGTDIPPAGDEDERVGGAGAGAGGGWAREIGRSIDRRGKKSFRATTSGGEGPRERRGRRATRTSRECGARTLHRGGAIERARARGGVRGEEQDAFKSATKRQDADDGTGGTTEARQAAAMSFLRGRLVSWAHSPTRTVGPPRPSPRRHTPPRERTPAARARVVRSDSVRRRTPLLATDRNPRDPSSRWRPKPRVRRARRDAWRR
eukprot:31199-Pelagococcus_subviridis.AAC.3